MEVKDRKSEPELCLRKWEMPHDGFNRWQFLGTKRGVKGVVILKYRAMTIRVALLLLWFGIGAIYSAGWVCTGLSLFRYGQLQEPCH